MESKSVRRIHIGREKLFTHNKSEKPFVLDVLFLTLKLLLVSVLIVGMAGVGLVYGVFKAYIDTTPMFDVAQLTKSNLTSFLYDVHGNQLMEISAIEYRDWVKLEDIPEMLRKAFISVEDVRFYKHSGVDFKRLFSAALEILGNSNSSGGSTITQQLIKNKVLGAERTYKRKIQEAFLALQCEKTLGENAKSVILEAYLNDIYLGGSNYGVKAAAKDYFNKELSELSVRECAMLAGLTQNPYRYNPRLNKYWSNYGRDPEAYDKYTVTRTNTVLRRMYENDIISQEQYENALAEDVHIEEKPTSSKMYDDYAYFVEYCIDDVITHWMEQDHVVNNAQNRKIYENKLRTGGYRIYTTLDCNIQKTVQDTLSEWDGYPELADATQNKITEIISDSITIETIEPQAAAVVMDQQTGEIRAIVGGRNKPEIRRGLNRATQSYTEVGSSIKPLSIYGPAIDNGASPATVIANTIGKIDGWGGEKGYPEGGLTSAHYGPVTMRYGLIESLNVVAARLLFSRYVGIETSVEYLKRMGINESQINKDGPGLALGTSGITPLQMCAAYSAIANNGYYNMPLSFTKVTDSTGKNVILNADVIRGTPKKVYSDPATAYILVDMMKSAVKYGTGSKAQIPGYEVAGKTGTNSDYASVFFAGMTCKYTAVVWIGHDQPANKLKDKSSGGKYAAVLWNLFMSKLMEGEESKPIIDETEASLGLVQRTVCPISGKLAGDACIHFRDSRDEFKKYDTVTDWFTYSNVPTETCDMHVTLSICRQSHAIAGKYCDPNDIEQRTFVLLRPGNQFYDLDDSVLDKLFGDTWVRTDRSTQQFISEYPVCTIDSSFEGLVQRGDALISAVEALVAEKEGISDVEKEYLDSLIDRMRKSSTSEDYYNVYDMLKQEFDKLILLP